MKVLIIGLGSMGQRRLRLIRKYDDKIQICGVVRKSEKAREIEQKYNITCYDSFDSAMEDKFDCVFVCSSPLSHAKIINKALHHGMHVFTELNLVTDEYQKNIELAKEKNLKLFISSTDLYRAEINYIKKRIEENKELKLNYIYHCGQYLPYWHPWEDYKKVFFADVKTNGVREIMAINFPWIFNLFGRVKSFQFIRSKNTALDLADDYMDNCLLMIEHENGNKGVLVIDVVSPKAETSLTIYGEKFFIKWDGTSTGLFELFNDPSYDNPNRIPLTNIDLYEGKAESRSEYAEFIVEDAYYKEIECFFGYVKNDKLPLYTFEEDMQLLKFIDRIESSLKGGGINE